MCISSLCKDVDCVVSDDDKDVYRVVSDDDKDVECDASNIDKDVDCVVSADDKDVDCVVSADDEDVDCAFSVDCEATATVKCYLHLRDVSGSRQQKTGVNHYSLVARCSDTLRKLALLSQEHVSKHE